jgi:hypothetical protein
MPERATASSRSEKSAEAVVVTGQAGEAKAGGEGPNGKEVQRYVDAAGNASDARANGANGSSAR